MSVYIIQTDILHKKVDRCIMMVLKGKMKEHTKKNEINPEAYNKNSGSCFLRFRIIYAPYTERERERERRTTNPWKKIFRVTFQS